jgi:cytosine/adenosine deaminase-related metal-dependent hydrolase
MSESMPAPETRVVAATWLLTGPHQTPIRDGAVALQGNRILEAGPREPLEQRHGRGERLDAVLMPALVNAHLHLELSALSERVAGGRGLAAWIERLLELRMTIPPPEADGAMARAIEALHRAGVAAVGEVSNDLSSVPHLARAGLVGTVFHEVYGLTAARADAAIVTAAEQRRELRPPPGLAVAPSPHAVYSTHRTALAGLLRGARTTIHLAEDPAERTFCATAGGPLRELARRRKVDEPGMPRLGRSAIATVAEHLHPGTLVVHAVDLDGEDLQALRASGATVVLCPRSNLHIGGRFPNLPGLIEAGIPLAVGTDSLASSPSLSPLAELATLRRAYHRVPAERILALGWNGTCVGAPQVGQLAPGRTPGVVAAPLAGARPERPVDWLLDEHGADERPFQWIARPEAA